MTEFENRMVLFSLTTRWCMELVSLYSIKIFFSESTLLCKTSRLFLLILWKKSVSFLRLWICSLSPVCNLSHNITLWHNTITPNIIITLITGVIPHIWPSWSSGCLSSLPNSTWWFIHLRTHPCDSFLSLGNPSVNQLINFI